MTVSDAPQGTTLCPKGGVTADGVKALSEGTVSGAGVDPTPHDGGVKLPGNGGVKPLKGLGSLTQRPIGYLTEGS